MKKIKVIAVLTTAVCGFYFTSVAQTDTTTTTGIDKQTTTQSSLDKMHSNDQQQSDALSLSATPTAEKSSQGYKVQMWVLPAEGTATKNFDTRYDSKSPKMGTDADVSGNVGTTGTGVSGQVGTTGTGVSGSVGTTETTTQTSQADRTETVRNENPAFNNQDFNDTVSAGTTSKTDLTDDWQATTNPIGQQAGTQMEKNTVIVKVIDESTGKEVNAEDIELKVVTPSQKTFTADLRHNEDHHTGELALNEDGTYSIQTTISTDDNKIVVIPFTFENKTDQFSDDLNNRNDNIDNDMNNDME